MRNIVPDTDPYKSPETIIEVNPDKVVHNDLDEDKLNGLRGWLLLVGFGIVVSPFRMIAQLYPLYTEIISNGSWALLTSPGSEDYNPAYAPLIIGEMIINVTLILCWLYIAFLFFSRRRAFPKWYIGIMAFTLIFMIGDSLYLIAFFPGVSINDPETIKDIIRSIVAAAIWIPYMLVSRRVKATFVR